MIKKYGVSKKLEIVKVTKELEKKADDVAIQYPISKDKKKGEKNGKKNK